MEVTNHRFFVVKRLILIIDMLQTVVQNTTILGFKHFEAHTT